MKLTSLGSMFVMLFTLAASAHEMPKPPQMPKEFETLKKLVGTWEGTTKMDGKDTPATVVYTITSGGTAIEEKLFPGTPHEMVSMYHKEGKSLAMTHYCAIGNQPHMVLKKADDKSLSFEMTKPIGVTSMKESHMHAVSLSMPDDDTLHQEWTNMKDGKKDEVAVFDFKRKK